MGDDWGTTEESGWGDGGGTSGFGDSNNNDKGCRICKEEGHFARGT